MNETLQIKIREAWTETNNNAPLTSADRVLSVDLLWTATRMVRSIRDEAVVTWTEARSEIAPEKLATPLPSVVGQGQGTS